MKNNLRERPDWDLVYPSNSVNNILKANPNEEAHQDI